MYQTVREALEKAAHECNVIAAIVPRSSSGQAASRCVTECASGIAALAALEAEERDAPNAVRGVGSGPLPGRNVTAVQTGDKTLFITTPPAPPAAGPAAPKEGQIVFVQGGVAQYRGGKFYTGMEDPRYQRPIMWDVKWWRPMDTDALAAPCECQRLREELATQASKVMDLDRQLSNERIGAEREIEALVAQLAAAKSEIARLRKATEEAQADAMIAHRWFAAQFGEVMNGRDFAVKIPMADEAMRGIATELRQAVDALRPFANVWDKRPPFDVTSPFRVDCEVGEYGAWHNTSTIVAAYAKHGEKE